MEEASGLAGPALTEAVAELYRSLACEVHAPAASFSAHLELRARHSRRPQRRQPVHGVQRRTICRLLRLVRRRRPFRVDAADRVGDRRLGSARCPSLSSPPMRPAGRSRIRGRSLRTTTRLATAPGPPCFARATRLGSTLLIGGTASILGEDTRHEGDVAPASPRDLRKHRGADRRRDGGSLPDPARSAAERSRARARRERCARGPSRASIGSRRTCPSSSWFRRRSAGPNCWSKSKAWRSAPTEAPRRLSASPETSP